MSFGEKFLTYPDLFPARPAGEAWGQRAITLDIAGPATFSGLTDAQLAAIQERYGPGLGDASDLGGATPPSVRIMRMGREEFDLFDRAGWSITVDLDQQPSLVRIAGYNFIGIIQLAPTLSGALWTSWTSEEHADELQCIVGNYYRIFTAYQALVQGHILLHSSAVVLDERAMLFFGHSGAGKSTLAGNAVRDGHRILSDDLNLILSGDTPRVRRIPFAGDFGTAPASARAERETYPLAGIYRLKKGDNEIRRLSPAVAFATIMGSAPFVNRDPHRYQQLADVTERLVKTFEPREIAASADGGFWHLLDQGLA